MQHTDLQIIKTSDGSLTLQQTNTAVAFRSTHGAATESQHVFVDGSSISTQIKPWHILELGLGTGLNFTKTIEAFLNSEQAHHLTYTAVECSVLSATFLKQLGSHNDSTGGIATELLLASLNHNSPEPIVYRTENKVIEFTLTQTHWQHHNIPSLQVDAYYHDPFAPNDNPQCWTTDCFEWAKYHLNPNGILVTYSASSAVRKAMSQAGLYIAKRPGACGKREMTLAAKRPELLTKGKLLAQSKQPHGI